MDATKTDTRGRILAAAQDLAREVGPGNLSLDAVAARAGVSKGGLLYHFPSKSSLMTGLVEDFVARFDAAVRQGESEGRANSVIGAYLDEFRRDRCRGAPPPSGLLAALAENPSLLDPVREQERDFLDRIRTNATDPDLATAAFLVVHGIRSMELLNVKVAAEDEVDGVLKRLHALLEERQGEPG
ncbi:MAG: TetR/AcrR family transcriptional regulator [Microvirga sp.]|nr:TetR/AcrR family transcriptional regulator [Microvirga sp.]